MTTQMPKSEKPKSTQKCPPVSIKPGSYQPNEKELSDDLRINASLEKAMGLLVKEVQVKVERE